MFSSILPGQPKKPDKIQVGQLFISTATIIPYLMIPSNMGLRSPIAVRSADIESVAINELTGLWGGTCISAQLRNINRLKTKPYKLAIGNRVVLGLNSTDTRIISRGNNSMSESDILDERWRKFVNGTYAYGLYLLDSGVELT